MLKNKVPKASSKTPNIEFSGSYFGLKLGSNLALIIFSLESTVAQILKRVLSYLIGVLSPRIIS